MSDDPSKYPDSFPGYEGMPLASLRRYIAGACAPEERRRVESWAAQSAGRQRYLAALRTLRERATADELREAAAPWNRIVARMEPPAHPADTAFLAPWERPATQVDLRERRRTRILAGAFPRRRTHWPALAAAVVIALVAGGLEAARSTHPSTPAPRTTARQIVTATGQRAEIQLDDGSRVVLGVASRLRLPATFGTGRREVYLDGTAYFDVVHDASHPFVVHTANAVTQDVGTRFVVSAYPASHATQVVVADGAVTLGAMRNAHSPRTSPVLLTGGHLGQLRAGDSIATTRRVDPTLYTAWMKGDLVFHDVPLEDAVAELRRWYGVDVRIGDPSLRSMPISASFAVESFHEALSVVTTVLPLRAVRRGTVVTLYRR